MNILRSYWVTTKHKFWVARYLIPFALRLIGRAITHDLSKYSPSEAPGFGRISKTSGVEYGSEEYRQRLRAEKPTIELHASRNSHHPEYWDNEVWKMPALDVLEMIADWIAASRRYKQRGDFIDSMRISQERYDIHSDLMIFLRYVAVAMLQKKTRA